MSEMIGKCELCLGDNRAIRLLTFKSPHIETLKWSCEKCVSKHNLNWDHDFGRVTKDTPCDAG